MRITSTLAGRVIFGAVLIAVALKIRQFDAGSADFVEASCKAGEKFCEFYRFGFVTLGLGGVWTLLLVVGTFYLVVYDWVAGYIRDIARDLAETATDIHNIANEHIRKHRFSKSELKIIIISIFGNSDGQNEPEGEKLGGFVADLLLYFRAGRIWRRQHNTSISISELASPSLKKAYFRWHQRTTYDLVGTTQGVKTHMRLHSSAECEAGDIQKVLEHLAYRIRVGTIDYDLKQVLQMADIQNFKSDSTWNNENFTVSHRGSLIKVAFDLEVDMPDHEVGVIIDEDSIILKCDQEYVHTITEATRGLILQFEVPLGHKVSACYASPAGYRNARAKVLGQPSPATIGNGGRKAEITSSSWVLPGITSVVIWR